LKKILLLSEIFPPLNGGSGRWFWDLYTRLPDDKVHFLVGKTKGTKEIDGLLKNRITRVDLTSTQWGLIHPIGLMFYLATFFKVMFTVILKNCDSIHCGRCLPEGFIGAIVKMVTGKSLVCYIHGEDIETAKTSREFVAIIKFVLRKADTVICNSENTMNLLMKGWSVQPDKVTVLYPGVDTKKFFPAKRTESNSAQNEFQIVTVGRLQKRKGHDVMLQAVYELVNKHGHADLHYSIVGTGDEDSELKAKCKSLKIDSYVTFLGEVSDCELVKIYQNSDLFILPNRTVGRDIEGFGIVLTEAQACGLPVVAGDSGGTRETMIVGETGYLVDCSTPVKLVELITKFINNRDLGYELGKKAQAHVSRTFSWDSVMEKAEKVFEMNRN
jgi:phosphatidylinositol alpha-1,6-mannosyltransferase